MAAMGPRSLSSSSPLAQDSPRLSATSPEPHYRLSRLNPPPPSANLRPPSMISRSMSAGMTFGFAKTPKDKERERELRRERERNNTTDMQSIRAPSPDGRGSSRFGKLRKKVSLATLISGSSSPQPDDLALSSRSTSSSSSGTGPTISLFSPEDSQPPSPEEEEDSSEPDEDQSATRRRFVKKSAWRTRYKTKLHPYPDVPYPQAYDPVVLQSERATHHLLRRLAPDGSPVFYNSTQSPPASVLDLGCGTGLWLLDAARMWRATQFIGFDLVDVAVPALTDGSISNVRLVRGDFLLCPLPFPDSQFELVRMANLQLAIPQHHWERVLREVRRVLAPGGRLELIHDDTIFPYGDVPAEELNDDLDIPSELTPGVSSTYPLLSPSTPRPPPPTPESSGFFDSSDDEDDGTSLDTPPETSDDEVVLLPTPDSSSERSSFTDTASTLVGDASERGSREFKKIEGTPQLHFEPIHHRPFSGIDHLVIAIPPALEALATVEVRIDESESEMPLTPVPPRAPPSIISRSSSAPMTPASATSTFSAPQTPVYEDFNIAPVTKGPWSDKATASVQLERIYTKMLSSKLGVNPRPGQVASPVLQRVFGKEKVMDTMSMHLKLAPVGCEEKKGVKLRGIKEIKEERRERKARAAAEKEKEKRDRDKERALDTPIPQGLSAKAAERLGIAGAGGAMPPPTIRRRPTLLDSPVESDEEDLLSSSGSDSEDHNRSEVSAPPPVPLVRPSLGTMGRGMSNWAPPSEWVAPPEEEHPVLASSATQKTITPANSSRTITSSRTVTQLSMVFPPQTEPQTRTTPTALKHTHTRAGSTCSAVSVRSAASSGAWSATGVFPIARASQGLVQHPGLLLWPATLIPLSPAELEMHTSKHMQTLLGCKAALGEYIGTFLDPETGKPMVSDEEFEDALWEYECFRRRRFNWPDLPEGRLDTESEAELWDLDMPTPASARSAFHAIPPRTPGLPEPSEGDPHPFGRYDLPHVRTFRVFSAVKEAF